MVARRLAKEHHGHFQWPWKLRNLNILEKYIPSGQIRTLTPGKKVQSSGDLKEQVPFKALAATKRGTTLKHIASGGENGKKEGKSVLLQWDSKGKKKKDKIKVLQDQREL